jgi:hypothetical protein
MAATEFRFASTDGLRIECVRWARLVLVSASTLKSKIKVPMLDRQAIRSRSALARLVVFRDPS